jgi:hypothetical protein
MCQYLSWFFLKNKKMNCKIEYFLFIKYFVFIFSNQAIADYLVTNGYTVSCKEFCREANIVCEQVYFVMFLFIFIF